MARANSVVVSEEVDLSLAMSHHCGSVGQVSILFSAFSLRHARESVTVFGVLVWWREGERTVEDVRSALLDLRARKARRVMMGSVGGAIMCTHGLCAE